MSKNEGELKKRIEQSPTIALKSACPDQAPAMRAVGMFESDFISKKSVLEMIEDAKKEFITTFGVEEEVFAWFKKYFGDIT